MGLADRLKAYQQEQAAREAAEAEVARNAFEQSKLAFQAKEMNRLAEERATRAKMIAELTPLLETVNARKQLEEIRKTWGTGKVDKEPTLTGASLELGIRFSFPDLVTTGYNSNYGTGNADAVRAIMRSEIAVLVSVKSEPNVSSSWELRATNREIHTESDISSSVGPTVFSRENSNHASQVLENQLFEIMTGKPNPLVVADLARKRISDRPRYVNDNLPWYKRIFR